jgi:integrase
MRHSFASYHLAKWGDAPKTSLELGHTSPGIVFAHYRELVKPHAAEAYWKLAPGSLDEVIAQETCDGQGEPGDGNAKEAV